MSHFIIVLLFFIVLGGLIEFYTYRALKSKWTNYSRFYRNLVKYAFLTFLILSAISLIIFFSFNESIPKPLRNFFFGFVMINFFVKIALSLVLLVDDLRRLSIWTKRKISKTNHQGEKISRSDFLVKSSIIAAAIPAISFPLGMAVGPYNYKIRREKLTLKNLRLLKI